MTEFDFAMMLIPECPEKPRYREKPGYIGHKNGDTFGPILTGSRGLKHQRKKPKVLNLIIVQTLLF
jgi:hypothetical protein